MQYLNRRFLTAARHACYFGGFPFTYSIVFGAVLLRKSSAREVEKRELLIPTAKALCFSRMERQSRS
jgi:hypothetical protein